MANFFSGLLNHIKKPPVDHPPSDTIMDTQPASAFTYTTKQTDNTLGFDEANEEMILEDEKTIFAEGVSEYN